jgi:hypothetical protein
MNGRNENNLARARTQFAYGNVAEWKKDWRKDALARVKGLPIQVRTQGLPVTLANLMGEDNTHSRHLADLIGRWLLEKAFHKPLGEDSGPASRSPARRLLDACINAERSTYLAVQAEALAFLEQVKLFADALYSSREEPDDH